MKHILFVHFYGLQPRGGLWIGEDVITTHIDEASRYTHKELRPLIKKLQAKYPHSFWQPLEVEDKNQNVIQFPAPDQEVQQQIDYSQDPGEAYHLCRLCRMDCIKLPSGVACLCGTGTTDGTA